MAYANIEDQKAYHRQHYLRHKDKYKEKAKRTNKEYLARNLRFLQKYKVLCGCQRCGFKKHHIALDFHHIGDKDMSLARMARDRYSIQHLREEIKKCIVLCSNCHRIEHANS